MITRYKYRPKEPFSLHDMTVKRMGYTEGSLSLFLSDDWTDGSDPANRLRVIIEDVDLDYTSVLILSRNGAYGPFKGEKLSLDEYLDKYKDLSFEIVDELYGYNMVEYSGFLRIKKGRNAVFTEMVVSVYYSGEISYETGNGI